MENHRDTKKLPYMTYPNGREVVTFSIDREQYSQLTKIANETNIRLTTAINNAIAHFVQTHIKE